MCFLLVKKTGGLFHGPVEADASAFEVVLAAHADAPYTATP